MGIIDVCLSRTSRTNPYELLTLIINVLNLGQDLVRHFKPCIIKYGIGIGIFDSGPTWL